MRNLLAVVVLSLLSIGGIAQAKDGWSDQVALTGTLYSIPFEKGNVATVEFRPTNDCQAVIVVHNRRGEGLAIPIDVVVREQQYLLENGLGVWAACDRYGDVYLWVKGMTTPEHSTGA